MTDIRTLLMRFRSTIRNGSILTETVSATMQTSMMTEMDSLTPLRLHVAQTRSILAQYRLTLIRTAPATPLTAMTTTTASLTLTTPSH